MARPRQRARSSAPARAGGGNGQFPFERDAAAGPSAVEIAIFEATEELLQSMSFAELTVADILKAADVSRTTFYRYFTSKHQVVSALLQSVQGELEDVMQPWFNRGERPPADSLRDAMNAVADVWTRHRAVLRASSENWHSDPEIGERWTAMMNRFTSDIAKQIDRERKAGVAPKGVKSQKLALQLTWGSERMLYLAGFGLCGSRMERDAVEAITATWLGTIYHT